MSDTVSDTWVVTTGHVRAATDRSRWLYRFPVIAATPALPPPAIEQPAAHQVSYGLVTGRAARGTARVLVHANGGGSRRSRSRGRRFTLRVTLPRGDVTVRVTTIGRGGRRSSAHVHDVFGLPPGSRPRVVASRLDRPLATSLNAPRPRLSRHGGLLRAEPDRRAGRGMEREGALSRGLDTQARDRRDGARRAQRDTATRLARRLTAARADHPVRRRRRERAPRMARAARRARARTA